MINQDLKRKLALYAKDPNLARFLEGQRVSQTIKGEKGDKGDTPVKGVDYFTPSEIQEIIQHVLRQATPVKGKHYFDGVKGDRGEKGEKGDEGKTSEVDEDSIVESVLKKINVPKDGKDAEIDEEKLVKKVLKLIPKQKKLTSLDISDFEQRFGALRDALMNQGGHGGTTIKPVLTTSDNQNYILGTHVKLSELQVYRGGSRIFSENGDFTYTLSSTSPSSVKMITLAIPLNVAGGETLNLLGKA